MTSRRTFLELPIDLTELFRWLVFAVYGYTYGIGFADHDAPFNHPMYACFRTENGSPLWTFHKP
ncbi:hypothetical protein OUZ56_023746 [Daphnia magna]|uniref:Uncharacterized protein n=1 Tax=Daphnia magna TaxID=35525 RepID=A0ABR0AZF1_9CRUS|nr:hypothetical protein OUZ56_023746 [Daphnia magna]